MSTEDLLKPRYKVIATWPMMDTSVYCLGELLYPNEDGILYDKKSMHHFNLPYYSHLFKKLDWWEEREEKDMPEFVKGIINREQFVGKLHEVHKDNAFVFDIKATDGTDGGYFSLSSISPSTESEYNEYLKQSNK